MSSKTIAKNFSFLTVIRGVNIAFPLILYTYVVGILGFELYGKIIYSSAIIAYFLVIVEYGFNISGTKSVSENRDDENRLGEIVVNILYCKLTLVLLSYLLLAISFLLIPFLRDNVLLVASTSLLLIADVFTPMWYFQGKEKLAFSTTIILLSKLLSFLLILIFVNSPGDYLRIPLIYGLCSIFSGFFLTFRMLNEVRVSKATIDLSIILIHLKQGFPFFFSRFFVTVRERIATIAIGAWSDYQYVAYLDLLQKITALLTTPIEMLNTAVYPRIAATRNLKSAYHYLYLSFGYSIVIYMILVFFPYDLISFLEVKKIVQPIVGYLPIFGLVIPIQSLIYFSGNTILIVFGHIKEFNFTVVLGGVIYLFLIGLGFYIPMGVLGVSICLVLSYSITAIGRFYYIKKYKLKYNGA